MDFLYFAIGVFNQRVVFDSNLEGDVFFKQKGKPVLPYEFLVTFIDEPPSNIRGDANYHAIRYEESNSTGISYSLPRTYPTTVTADDVSQVTLYDDYSFPHAGIPNAELNV